MQAIYKETRKVTDSSGKKFTCTYSLFYNTKTVSKSKSSVSCSPNTVGKVVSEDFVIDSLGKTVTVKHTIKKGKEAISAISLKDSECLFSNISSYPTIFRCSNNRPCPSSFVW